MTLGAFEFPPVSHLFNWPEFLFKDTPLGVNKDVVLMLAAVVLVGALFIVIARRFERIPGKTQAGVEALIDFVDQGIIREAIGPEGRPWLPFLTTMFLFLFVLNFFEVVPVLSFPPTSRFALPFYLALQTWVIFVVVGAKSQGWRYFAGALFPPGVPKPLYVLITPIELVSTFIVRPFSLAVRLFANLFAGHLLLTVFFLLSASVWALGPSIAWLPVTFAGAVALTGFEILVSVLQAYIFTILTAVYIGDSMHPHH